MKIILSTFVLSFLILSSVSTEAYTVYSYDYGNGFTDYSGDLNGYSYDYGNGFTDYSGDLNGYSYDYGNGFTDYNFR